MQPGQMENLLMMLEEELNYSKKQSRSRINALMREAGQARTQVSNELCISILRTLLTVEQLLKAFQHHRVMNIWKGERRKQCGNCHQYLWMSA